MSMMQTPTNKQVTDSVTTNRHWRQFRYRDEVPASVLAGDLDWTDEDNFDGYIHYKGYWYHLSEFMSHSPDDSWDGSKADSFFSGVVIRLSEDGEEYQIGTWIA